MINYPMSLATKAECEGEQWATIPVLVSFYFSSFHHCYILCLSFPKCDGHVLVTLTDDPTRQCGFAINSGVALQDEFDLPTDASSVDWLWYPKADPTNRLTALRFFVSAAIMRGANRIFTVEHPSWPGPLDRASVKALVSSIICDPHVQEGRVVVHYCNDSDWDTGIYGDVQAQLHSRLKSVLAWIKRRLS